MKLTILGSGTSVPHPRRASPGFWLDAKDQKVLLDIGPDIPHRMAEEELDWPDIDAIWISHFHLDHFGGFCAEERHGRPLLLPQRCRSLQSSVSVAHPV